jgi:flagellin
MNAHRNLSATDTAMGKSLEKLSSGFRINRAGDDAAGLSISEGLRAQIGGLKVAVRNSQDGVSVVQTAEGALTETHAILQRMRDLAVQAANGGGVDKAAQGAADTEFGQLALELDDIADKTKFGGTNLLDGNYTADFQVGANAGEKLAVTIDNGNAIPGGFGSTDLGLGVAGVAMKLSGGADVAANVVLATAALTAVDAAIGTVSTARATLGATQNRFEHKINNLNVTVENLSASESRIRDVDMAQEMMSFTKSQILSQAGTAMLAQANQSSQGVLSLLR